MGLCVFSFPISPMMIVRIHVLYLIIIVILKVWPICHCLGLGHKTTVCAACVSIFFFFYIQLSWSSDSAPTTPTVHPLLYNTYAPGLLHRQSSLEISKQLVFDHCGYSITFYPVLCPKLTLIQVTWFAYPYHLVFLIWYPYSLVFLIWYPYALTSFWVWHCYGLLWTLYCHKDCYCDVTMIWPLLFHGIRADVSETPNNALIMRMHGDHRLSIERFFVGFNAICYTFLGNNPIYIERRNCRLSTVPGFMQ